MKLLSCLLLALLGFSLILPSSIGAENVMITGVPDYDWYSGCFGTASGNLMGYWDRNGFPDFYTGPTNDGLAPLSTAGSASKGIRSMWASKAGFDGRPANMPGHIDDYWTYFLDENSYSYESTAQDPYQAQGRAEHAPDCLGDFIGASQNKWADLNGECSGNIDAFAFNFWDKSGSMRTNFVPPALNGVPVRDVQSGLRAWTQYRGYDATVSSQLVDFNPVVPSGRGFHFEDLRAEILRGYPVILMLQNPGQYSRNLSGMPRGNPDIHAMLAFHFVVTDDGQQLVQYRTSWGSGEASETWAAWGPQVWAAGMTLRGVILYHPVPRIRHIERANGNVTLSWDGPVSTLWDDVNQVENAAHTYIVERATSLSGQFGPVGDPTSSRAMTFPDSGTKALFFRIRVTHPAYDGIGAL